MAGHGVAGLAAKVFGGEIGNTVFILQAMEVQFKKLASTIEEMVAAFSPGTIIYFNDALQDLNATIGQAFEPAMQLLGGAFREIAAIIQPAMQSLVPVINVMTEQIIAVTKGGLNYLAAILEVINPALQIMATTTKDMFEILNVIIVVYKTLVQSFMSLFGGMNLLEKTLAGLAVATKQVISGFLIMVANMAKMFGGDDFLKNLIKNLQPTDFEKHAATAPAIKGIEQIGKDFAMSSFVAAGPGDTQKSVDLSDVVKQLEAIQAGEGPTWVKEIKEDLKKIAAVADKLSVGNLRDTGSRIAQTIADPTGLLGKAANKIFGK